MGGLCGRLVSSFRRGSFSANLGSFELFPVFTDWKVTDSSRRICRNRTRLMASTTPSKTRVSGRRSRDQSAGPCHPWSFGRERAKVTMALRISGVNFGSGPGLFFG